MNLRPSHQKVRDTGAALMTVVMVIAMLSVLGATLAALSINNLTSSRMSQQAGASLNAANAGVSQAITYLRTNGVLALNRCSPTCASEPWGNRDSPASVTIPGKLDQRYKVWIEVIEPFPENTPGVYRIHSAGTAGGPAGRAVEVDAYVDTYEIPLGIMATSITGGGNAATHRVSMFSTGCIYKRSKITFEGIDAAYGIPSAAHSSQIITDSQGSGQYCPNTRQPIHDPDRSGGTRYCDPQFPYDQDANGGSLAGTPCQGSGGVYPQTSLIGSEADLFSMYRMKQPVFTRSQLDGLKAVAISQGSYYQYSTGWTTPTDANSVLYFDLGSTDPGGLVNLNNITGWGRATPLAADSAACLPRSLTIVIEGGNARLNSNQVLAASVFLVSGDPYGQLFKANGTANFIGTVYANQLDLTGTVDMSLDECFIANRAPALSTVETYNYREVDR